MRKTALLLLCVLPLNGCFAYVPSQGQALRQGQAVQVFLNTPQDVRLADVTANNVVRVDGEIVRLDTAQLVMSATLLTQASGIDQLGQNATVVIPRGHVDHIQEKRFSVLRSAGLVGLAALVTALTAGAVSGGPSDAHGGGVPSGT